MNNQIRLIHWNQTEAEERAENLRKMGYEVDGSQLTPSALRVLRQNPPAVVVIDLSRLPSQGRDIGMAIRYYKATRFVPLVFVDGEPNKVAMVQKQLPDALYTTWSEIRNALTEAKANPPKDPQPVRSLMEGYSGAPLVKKLGIKDHYRVQLIQAPNDFEEKLENLPQNVVFSREEKAVNIDLILWFTRSKTDLEQGIDQIVQRMGKSGLWMIWPKKSSKMTSDLTQVIVRKIGLANGLVDYKVCSVDETWSGLKFTRKKRKK